MDHSLIIADTTPVLQAVTDAASDWSSRVVLGNTVRSWITAAIVLFAIHLVFWIVRTIVLHRLAKVAKRTTTRVDDVVVGVLSGVRFWVVLLVALAAASAALVLPTVVERTLRGLAVFALSVQALIASRVLVGLLIERTLQSHRGPDGTPDPTVASGVGILRFLAMLVVGVVVLLLALENMGVKATPLVTSLGIGGIAVALAAQNILGNLFGSLTIIFDKPFVVGDAIKVGDFSGTVERIGIKTTRVRSMNGEEVVFANSDLLSSRIQNFKSLQERRIAMTLAVEYATPPAKLRQIPAIVKGVIEAQPHTRFDRCNFRDLGAYSLNFEYIYIITTPDFAISAKTQEEVNFQILERFAREGIEFAFPTQVAITRTQA